jgi:Flp pilus assembly protein TadB
MTLSLILVAVALIGAPGPGPAVAAARLPPKPAPRAPSRRALPPALPVVAGAIAAALALTVGRDAGGVIVAAVAGLFVAAATHACSAERRAPTRRDGAGLPLALELISAALRSGAPFPTAAQAVATTPGLAVGPDLARAATMLRLGADPMEAWARIASVDDAALLGAVAARSARSGVRLADTISRQADLLRAEIQTKAIRRAHRVGAVALLPLGLCYLPAFVCLGIVPMVAGLAAQAGR